jgi:polar amino acid transport system substrate-binding protein
MEVRATWAWVLVLLCVVALPVVTPLLFELPVRSTPDGTRAEPPALREQTRRTIVLCSDPWPPYAATADSSRPGYIVELAREIFGGAGITVRYVNKPWSRCIAETRSGKLHGLAGADVDEVPGLIFSRRSLGVTRPTFFTAPDSQWQYRGIPSLADIRLGYIQDYTYAPEIDRYLRAQAKPGRVFAVRGNRALDRLIALVDAGRIDAFIENAPVVHATLRELGRGTDGLRPAGSPGAGVPLYLAMSPVLADAHQLVERFDAGLDTLRQDGRLTAILARYGLTDWETSAGRPPAAGR